jgi:hypothetical protein
MQSMVVDHDTEQWTIGVERRFTQYFRRNAERFRVPDLPEPWDKVGWWEVMAHPRCPDASYGLDDVTFSRSLVRT